MNGTIDAMARAIIDKVYPVNVIVEFSLETDPNTVIGCGTKWERFAAGRTLIGKSDTYAIGWEGGEATHTITANEMPSHQHVLYGHAFAWGYDVENVVHIADATAISGTVTGNRLYTVQGSWDKTDITGSGMAHENMQPSRAVDRWVRVA